LVGEGARRAGEVIGWGDMVEELSDMGRKPSPRNLNFRELSLKLNFYPLPLERGRFLLTDMFLSTLQPFNFIPHPTPLLIFRRGNLYVPFNPLPP